MNIRKDARYAIACPSSMGLRITPEDRMAVHNSNRFYLQATSAETNVLNVTSSLGPECLVMTRFVAGSPLAAFIKAQLRARNIAFVGPEVPQGGPWGYRHQFNVADSGFGLRAPRVWNDRAGEVGRTLDAKDYDTAEIFGRKGVAILHLSGLIAAMSPETTKACLALAKAAKKHGTLVSFDLNYRATFWKGREAELKRAFHQIASVADILVGNEEDFQLCLGMKGPEAGGKDLAAKIESFKGMIETVAKKYRNAKMFATTLRQVVSAGRHLWGAILRADGKWFVEEPREIDVLDRIGGGDGFTGGLLYGVLKGWDGDRRLLLRAPRRPRRAHRRLKRMAVASTTPVRAGGGAARAHRTTLNPTNTHMKTKADIGLVGLAVMGENLVMNMESKGFTVAVFNRTVEKVDAFVNGRGAGTWSARARCSSWSRPAPPWTT